MELKKAQVLASEIKAVLEPQCEKIVVAGSIRRQRPVVNDIDIVLVAKDWWEVNSLLMRLGKIKMSGKKLARVAMDGDVQLDVYFATPETFATLLLIRTGSKENNIRLCTIAQKKGWRLCADGSGLFNEHGERIAGDSEESIYQALGLRYQLPEERY